MTVDTLRMIPFLFDGGGKGYFSPRVFRRNLRHECCRFNVAIQRWLDTDRSFCQELSSPQLSPFP